MAGTRQVSDPNDILDVYFNEASGTVFTNHGTAGATGDFNIIVDGGSSIHDGVSGGVFGNGVQIDAGGSPLIYGPDNTTLPYSANQVNASIFFTPTDFVGANNHGRIFFKQDQANGVWSGNFTSLGVEFSNTSGDWQAFLVINGVKQGQFFTNAVNPIALNKPHMLGMSFDSSGLWTIYLDGFAVGTPQSFPSGTLNLGAGSWTLGGVPSGNSGFPAEQCAALYEELRVTTVAQPALWWQQAWDLATGQDATITADSSFTPTGTLVQGIGSSISANSSFTSNLVDADSALASMLANSSFSASLGVNYADTVAFLANSSLSANESAAEFITASMIASSSLAATARETDAIFSTMAGSSSTTFLTPTLSRAPRPLPPPPAGPFTGIPLRETPKPSFTPRLGISTRRNGA